MLQTLCHLGMIKKDEQVALRMPGGTLVGFVDGANDAILKTEASLVFTGTFENRE